ncbi:hypothetical protein ACFQL4_02240 [Halosimplex aquaticum]
MEAVPGLAAAAGKPLLASVARFHVQRGARRGMALESQLEGSL